MQARGEGLGLWAGDLEATLKLVCLLTLFQSLV